MKRIMTLWAVLLTGMLSNVHSQTNLAKQTIVAGVLTTPAPVIEFLGDASIQKSLTSGAGIPANTGIGVVYREILNKKYGRLYSIELGLSINVASTVDTLKTSYDANKNVLNKSDYGNSILLPNNSGQAFNFYTRLYFTKMNGGNRDLEIDNNDRYPKAKFISGGYLNLTGSNRTWLDTLNKLSTKASTLSLQVGFFHEFVAPASRENYSITLGAGYTSRWILGDMSYDVNDDTRKRLTGSNKTLFKGAEIIFGFRLKNIKAEVRLPFLSKKEAIPGLSGSQPNTFIGFTGGFPLKLN